MSGVHLNERSAPVYADRIFSKLTVLFANDNSIDLMRQQINPELTINYTVQQLTQGSVNIDLSYCTDTLDNQTYFVSKPRLFYEDLRRQYPDAIIFDFHNTNRKYVKPWSRHKIDKIWVSKDVFFDITEKYEIYRRGDRNTFAIESLEKFQSVTTNILQDQNISCSEIDIINSNSNNEIYQTSHEISDNYYLSEWDYCHYFCEESVPSIENPPKIKDQISDRLINIIAMYILMRKDPIYASLFHLIYFAHKYKQNRNFPKNLLDPVNFTLLVHLNLIQSKKPVPEITNFVESYLWLPERSGHVSRITGYLQQRLSLFTEIDYQNFGELIILYAINLSNNRFHMVTNELVKTVVNQCLLIGGDAQRPNNLNLLLKWFHHGISLHKTLFKNKDDSNGALLVFLGSLNQAVSTFTNAQQYRQKLIKIIAKANNPIRQSLEFFFTKTLPRENIQS